MPSEKLVKDFMRPLDQCHYVKEEDTVKEALRLMAKAREEGKPLCLIVVGEEPSETEMIKGFVTAPELVFKLTTRFLKGVEKSGPIFWEGQFEAECLDGMNKRVTCRRRSANEKRKFCRPLGRSCQRQAQGIKGPRLIDLFSSAGGTGGGVFAVSSMT